MEWNWTRITAFLVLVFFVGSVIGCGFIEGYKIADTPEYKAKIREVNAKLRDAKEKLRTAEIRVNKLAKVVKKAREAGWGIKEISELIELGKGAKDEVVSIKNDVVSIKTEIEEIYEMGQKDVEGKGTWAVVGLITSIVLNAGLGMVSGKKGKALAAVGNALGAVISGIEKLDLKDEQKAILEKHQLRVPGVHETVKNHLTVVRKIKKEEAA